MTNFPIQGSRVLSSLVKPLLSLFSNSTRLGQLEEICLTLATTQISTTLPLSFTAQEPTWLLPELQDGEQDMPRAEESLHVSGPTGKVEGRAADLQLWTKWLGQVTLEDSQEAVGRQVALRVVAELQSLRGAPAPPAGPLLNLRDTGICPGDARLTLAADVGAGWLKHRVLDTITLHSAKKPLPSTGCKRHRAATFP